MSSSSQQTSLLQQQLATLVDLDPESSSLEQILSSAIQKVSAQAEVVTVKRRCVEGAACGQNGSKSSDCRECMDDISKLQEVGEEEEEGEEEEQVDEGVENWIEEFALEEIQVSEQEMKEFEDIQDKSNPINMEWMIAPLDETSLQEQFLDQSCLLLRRPSRQDYYQNLFSQEAMRSLLKNKSGILEHTYDIDVVHVGADGKRSNFGGEEGDLVDIEATLKLFDQDGCSIRLLHPQRWGEESWCRNLWTLLAQIENDYSCRTGCNVYWTPGNGKQGFSAHYDDIDAFILQIEGSKYWKVYSPPESDVLDRFSSKDFGGTDLGDPIFEGEVNPGDLLYLPRGAIHQAYTSSQTPSLHLTVSMNQRCTYRDFLERHLAVLWEDRVTLRRTIPSARLFAFMGTQNCDKQGQEFRDAVVQEVEQILCDPMSIDETVDAMIAEFQSARLPMPLPTNAKKKHCVDKNTWIKTTYENAARMLPVGEGEVAIVHCFKNSFTSHCVVPHKQTDNSNDPQRGWLKFPVECAEILEFLLGLEDFQKVADIKIDAEEDNDQNNDNLLPVPIVQMVQKLVDEGVLIVKE